MCIRDRVTGFPPEYAVSNEQGTANFSFIYEGKNIPGELECESTSTAPCAIDGRWRVLVHFLDTQFFVEEFLNSTPLIFLGDELVSEQTSFFTARVTVVLLIALSFALLIGAIMYRNYAERRRIEIIRGILTDSLMSLKASNDCLLYTSPSPRDRG